MNELGNLEQTYGGMTVFRERLPPLKIDANKWESEEADECNLDWNRGIPALAR
jgi:hypothetical protein